MSDADTRRLIEFLPRFSPPRKTYTERWGGGDRHHDGSISMPYPVYHADVIEFFELVAAQPWAERGYSSERTDELANSVDLISSAALEEVYSVLVYCCRGERFCDGHWEMALERGVVAAALRRLSDLVATPRAPEVDEAGS